MPEESDFLLPTEAANPCPMKSGSRINQSHSSVSVLHSMRSNLTGWRENSPKRIFLCAIRTNLAASRIDIIIVCEQPRGRALRGKSQEHDELR